MSRDRYPWPRDEATLSVAVGVILSIITCMIYCLFWQYKQIKTLNAWLGREEFSFAMWLLLSIVTCGIFSVYYWYKMSTAINELQEHHGQRVQTDLPVLSPILGFFVTPIVSLALQQDAINKLYGGVRDF